MNDHDQDVTRPLVLPRFGIRERSRALLLGSGAVGLVGLLDTLISGVGPRTPVWAGWFTLLLLGLGATERAPRRLAEVVHFAVGVTSATGLAALAWVSGGAASPLFDFLLAVPLLSAIATPGELREPLVSGVPALAAGVGLLVQARTPPAELALWTSMGAVAIAFAVLAGQLQRRRQAAFFQVERERADALARLAEAERARTAVERWAAMGQVADQVAHDVNSPLGALRSSLAYARAEIQAGEPEAAIEAIVDAADCVERIRLIVAELGARGGFPRGGERRS